MNEQFFYGTAQLVSMAKLNVTDPAQEFGEGPKNRFLVHLKPDQSACCLPEFMEMDSFTLVVGDPKPGDRIRVYTSSRCRTSGGRIQAAFLAPETFPDLFQHQTFSMYHLRHARNYIKRKVVEHCIGQLVDPEKDRYFDLKSSLDAIVFSRLSADIFPPHRQSDVERTFHNSGPEKLTRLNILLGVTERRRPPEGEVSLLQLREQLDAHFFGMGPQKDALIRHFAASRVSGRSGTVICLVGPAGTGKTALVRTLGKLLKRPYVFLPCSGLTTALDILGERSVYQSATFGKLVDSFYHAGTTDCLFHLDEFDKMPSSQTASHSKDGTPYYSFLQVFSERSVFDTYLNAELPCPNTVFICTCNSLDPIPSFIRNRFDVVIQIPPYADQALLEIARRHLIPCLMAEYQVPEGAIRFQPEALEALLHHLDDFGARRLSKYLEDIFKQIVANWALADRIEPVTVQPEDIRQMLSKSTDLSNLRILFRQFMRDYTPAVRKKIIELEEQLDNPALQESRKQFLQRQFHYLVRLRPDFTPFSFQPEQFFRLADRQLYGLRREKHLLASLFYELSLRKRSSNKRILLVGPPGVGKTALIEAAAKASGLPYVRINLGGVHHPATLRGAAQSFHNADAGMIVRAVTRQASSLRVLIHLDELDKTASKEVQEVLLSLLDDSGLFSDDFLEGIPLDFRNAVFIATANDYTISPALYSRFTVIQVGGYSRNQQEEILRGHLITSACEGYPFPVTVTDGAARSLMRYVETNGVRDLKEKVNRVVRETVFTKRTQENVSVQEQDVRRVLGPAPLERGNRPKERGLPGVANGLAVSGGGKGLCFAVESRLLPGRGLEITGLPSDVVRDSVRLAMGVLTADFNINLEQYKVHIHFAEGAVPKDGPSAGTAIFLSLYSAAVRVPIPAGVCLTGEIDLFGGVWAVGGILEKAGAAEEAGMRTLFLPHQNRELLTQEEQAQLSQLRVRLVAVNHVRELIQRLFPRLSAV